MLFCWIVVIVVVEDVAWLKTLKVKHARESRPDASSRQAARSEMFWQNEYLESFGLHLTRLVR